MPALAVAALAAILGSRATPALADDVLHVGAVQLDRPTLVALGVQLFVTGDDDHDAQVTVRFRAQGDATWRTGLPLFRVRPEHVVGRIVQPQFAGSIFDLAPATTYDIELHATDPDGGVDQTIALAGTTRAIPAANPENPTHHAASSAAALQSALSAAQAGDVIDVADGTYTGQFVITASGTAADPIFIRGTSRDGTVLDGNGCGACNVLEVYGSHVVVEDLTLQHANRAIRFQGASTTGNVLRRVHVRDVTLGIGSKTGQTDFYLCDDVLEGRLAWPRNYFSDGGQHSDDDGINLSGSGHVVCHNEISGFGDSLKLGDDGARAIDFYGNEVLSSYDNGIEFDGSEGNMRAFRNRFTNTFATLSFQPVYGGPAYAFRNVIVNVANEQLKLHGLGITPPPEPSGVLVYNNTFVSADHALNLQTSATAHDFVLANNLFVGPASGGGKTVDWSAGIDGGTIDWNGWLPDGVFDFDDAGTWASFAAMQASGIFESHGRLLAEPIFASGLAAPASSSATMLPADATLAPTSNAIDAALELPNVNDASTGSAPDLGALERDCPLPIFGVRPAGFDESNEPTGCGGPPGPPPSPPGPTTIRTTALTLRDPANPNGRRLALTSTTKGEPLLHRVLPPAPGSSADPTVNGATLVVYNAAGSGEKAVVSLPPPGWTRIASGYRFTSTGAVKSVSVVIDKLKVTARGTSWAYALTAPAQGRIALRLALGTGTEWCASAPPRNAASDRPGVFAGAPKSPPPATCPTVP
ncbi:MAG TPA: hypothetical protein VFD92_12130 [Candidatus Binatia bacterium]|nr:hypothetical protein [Candidatus Binatia bacterium]